MAAELEALARQLRDDKTLRVLIVTGAGRLFCAGADIASLEALQQSGNLADGAYRFLGKPAGGLQCHRGFAHADHRRGAWPRLWWWLRAGVGL